MLVFFGIFELDADRPADIVVLRVDGQLYLLSLLSADFVKFLILLRIEFDIDFHRGGQPSEKGCNFVLLSEQMYHDSSINPIYDQ